jgi:Arc/MetJ-type ribon-helix-helix transcriptional regulator
LKISLQKFNQKTERIYQKMAEPMITKGVRMRPEQWKLCEQMSKDFGYKSPSEFIREAVEFLTEWKTRSSSEKFLTPALESVVRATVRDSENRTSRLLFKNAVELHLLTRLIYHDFRYKPEEVEALREEAVRLVGETNGSLNMDYIDVD